MSQIRLYGQMACRFVLVGVALLWLGMSIAQAQVMPPGNIRLDNQGRPMGPGSRMQGADSLQQRDRNEDSITIYYRMFDSTRVRFIDSSMGDFTLRFPLPAHHVFLNHPGGASHSLLFAPQVRPGFEAGMRAFDAYHFHVEGTKLYNTTRPYTELDYLLGARAEQNIRVLHTQNVRPLWNGTFEYRLFNSPGHFKNASANHSALRFSSDFVSENRRYSGVFVAIRNRSRVNENGGILNDSFLVSNNPAFTERFNLPTWLGGDDLFSTNFFASNLNVGNDYLNRSLYFKHQYDIGQKDSTLNEDSSVTRRFYPRLRLQHTLNLRSSNFLYTDVFAATDTNVVNVYKNRFGLPVVDTPFVLQDRWSEVTNEFAVLLFPEKNNQEQYLKLGAGLQLLTGTLGGNRQNLNSTYLLAEYRNRTRNRKWDINAQGKFFSTGPYLGNYSAAATVQRDLGAQLGLLRLGFQNINRTPSFVFDQRSSFLKQAGFDAANENWTILTGDLYINKLRTALKARYYLVSNFTYWSDYAVAAQDATLQNVLHISGERQFKLTRLWNWYAEVHLQQATGSSINLPLIYTRNRIALEGVFYKNLTLSTGLDIRYFSPFNADDYSPFNGQWINQNRTRISNLPDIAAYLHFRISSFRAYLRAENLNTMEFGNGFNWTNNNLGAPLYANPGFLIRVGIHWTFVN